MTITRFVVAWLSLSICVAVAHDAHARDVRAAQAEVDAAKLSLAGKKYVEAAEHMEKAFTLDPNPLWLANAGFARMMAGQLERAVEALSGAIADKTLVGDARQRAVDRLGKASAAKAFIQRSEESKAAGDIVAAARAYDEALTAVPIGPYAIEAAALWERAKDYAAADARYRQAIAAGDLTPEQSAHTADALARVARLAAEAAAGGPTGPGGPPGNGTVMHPPDSVGSVELPGEKKPEEGGGSPVLGWVLVGSGAAVGVVGVVLLIVGNGKASDLADAQREAADGGAVTSITRNEALALESDASTFQTVGVIGAILGGAVAATGAVLVATSGGGAPETRGDVHVGAGVSGGRWLLTAGGSF